MSSVNAAVTVPLTVPALILLSRPNLLLCGRFFGRALTLTHVRLRQVRMAGPLPMV